jgi:hypothetical protein
VIYLYLEKFVVFLFPYMDLGACFLDSPAFLVLILYQMAISHIVELFMFASVPFVLFYFNSHKSILTI